MVEFLCLDADCIFILTYDYGGGSKPQTSTTCILYIHKVKLKEYKVKSKFF